MAECLNGRAFQKLPVDIRAQAQRLANETLRGMERADRLLESHLRRPPPLTVMNVLRVGTVELCTGGAAHGVVNSMVNLVGGHRQHARLKGLVNAVLRKVVAEGPEAWPKMRVPRLPDWLREPLSEAWGAPAIAAIEAAHFAGAPLDITKKANVDLAKALDAQITPTGSLRRSSGGQVSKLPGFDDGQWWVQDAAAALPARILNAQPGEKLLDLCAAPGGKTLQLAAVGADVTALDISEGRMARVTENLNRTGLSANIVVGDALTYDAGPFDAILLDAPCSATGTIRRHPDLPYAKDGSEFYELIMLQSRMLDQAWTLLRPGGRMVFCTCSLLPDEGEVQIEEALTRHPDMRVDPTALKLPGILPDWVTEEGGLRLRPDYWADIGGMDGFYMACLIKSN